MPPPDYWADARLVPEDKLEALVEDVRASRKALGLSNAALCREVRALILAHNKVPGRDPVHVKKVEDREYGEQGKYELDAIRKGARKYIVGYLAWLCLKDEKSARALYKKMRLPFRPYREIEQTDGATPSDVAHDLVRDGEVDFEKASTKQQFLVYEIAFLWYERSPPPVEEHESAMTPEIAQMKRLLHLSIDLGKLKAEHIQGESGGYARIVQREELRRFAEEAGFLPKFLFPDRTSPTGDMSAAFAKVIAELDDLISQLPKPVTNWAEEYSRNEWAIYEAAFLWHDFAPPPIAVHEQVMPESVRQTKRMLHDAANANALAPSVDDGVRKRNVLIHGTRHVSRFELRRFATFIDQRPRFLFPEDEA